MAVTHRYNTSERQHYLLEQHYSFRLKPQLLYVGQKNSTPTILWSLFLFWTEKELPLLTTRPFPLRREILWSITPV